MLNGEGVGKALGLYVVGPRLGVLVGLSVVVVVDKVWTKSWRKIIRWVPVPPVYIMNSRVVFLLKEGEGGDSTLKMIDYRSITVTCGEHLSFLAGSRLS